MRQLKDYWQVLSVFVSLVVCLIYFVIESDLANQQITAMTKENDDLRNRLTRVEAELDIFENVFRDILETPPQIIEYRLNEIENTLKIRRRKYEVVDKTPLPIVIQPYAAKSDTHVTPVIARKPEIKEDTKLPSIRVIEDENDRKSFFRFFSKRRSSN